MRKGEITRLLLIALIILGITLLVLTIIAFICVIVRVNRVVSLVSPSSSSFTSGATTRLAKSFAASALASISNIQPSMLNAVHTHIVPLYECIRCNDSATPLTPNLLCIPDSKNKVNLCHYPGTLNQDVSIGVSDNAYLTHLAHGDTCGPCNVCPFVVVKFGYAAWHKKPSVTIPVGPSNRVLVDGVEVTNAGQPTVFYNGRTHNAFEIVVPRGALVQWSISYPNTYIAATSNAPTRGVNASAVCAPQCSSVGLCDAMRLNQAYHSCGAYADCSNSVHAQCINKTTMCTVNNLVAFCMCAEPTPERLFTCVDSLLTPDCAGSCDSVLGAGTFAAASTQCSYLTLKYSQCVNTYLSASEAGCNQNPNCA